MTPAERLERATWDLFWLPPEARVIDRPELLAHATSGRGSHFNAVARARASGDRLAALIAETDALFAGAAATGSRWQVTDTTDPAPVEDQLQAAGFHLTFEHDARLIDVERYKPRANPGLEVRRISSKTTLGHSYDITDAAFGPSDRDADAERELALFTAPGSRAAFFVAYDHDRPISCGGLNLYRELGVALLWGGATIPEARGRGAYSAVVAARIAAARAAGVGHAGLYARVESSSPIAAAQGFERCGAMRYWQRDRRQ